MAFGPYSPVRQAGTLYFVSGQVGIEPKSGQAAAGVQEQTTQALRNLQSALAGAGLQTNDVIKTTIFLTNMADFTDVNKVYEQFFEAPRPARSCVGVRELPRLTNETLLIEIEAIACKP